MVGGITLFRRDIDEFYLSQGFPHAHEELEAVRGQLEKIGMYELCRQALVEAETLVRAGPDHDQQAEDVLLAAGGRLARASGSFDKLQRRFKAVNDAGPAT